MLEIKSQGKIVERIVRTKTGEFVLATFFVVEINGELQIRLVSVKPAPKEKIVALPVVAAKSLAVTSERHVYSAVVSPFFNKFEFLVSQPTRAPSGSY